MRPVTAPFTSSLYTGVALLILANIFPLCHAEQPAKDPGAGAGEPVNLDTLPLAQPTDPKIAALVEQLGAPDAVQREDAERALLGVGKDAVAALKAAETSKNPEIAFRAKRLSAKLSEISVKLKSYADVLPSDTVMYFEFRDAPTTIERVKQSPIGQFWEKKTMKAFFSGYRGSMLDTELKVLDAIFTLPRLASGKAALAISSPDTIEANEIDPPLVYLLESKNMQAVEIQVRNMFAGMNDEVKTKREYKKFQIEEQNNACTVFGAERLIHALTPKAMDSFLDAMRKPPEKPLSVLLTDLKAKRPAADFYFRLSADGLKPLAESNQIIDDELFKMAEAAGFTEDGFFELAGTLNSDGIEEFARFSAGGDTRNKGLFSLLQRMSIKPAAPLQANKPQALDLIPFQAAVVITFSGDAGKHAVELAGSLKMLDALSGVVIRNDQLDPNLTTLAPKPKADDGTMKPPRPPSLKPMTNAEKALDFGGGDVLTTKNDPKINSTAGTKEGDKKVAKKERAAEPERTMPHIERLRKSGFLLEELLAQSDGPMVLALFPERVDITKLANPGAADNPTDPDHIPMGVLFAMYVKDPAAIEKALEKASSGIDLNEKQIKQLYTKTTLNGGTFYAEDADENSPGFWLRGNYFAYGSAKGIIELAGAAMLNQNGTERMSARKTYIDYMDGFFDPNAVLNIYGDSRQFFEMPYKLAQLQWQENPKNPWPDYAVPGGILTGNTICIRVKQKQGGLQIESQTPISMVGLLAALIKPLKEAALFQFP